MVARLARGDVNMPDFDGFPIEKQIPEAHFEAATYRLLRSVPEVRASNLLYYRAPEQKPGPKVGKPADISGRRLMVFERTDGVKDQWNDLENESKVRSLLLCC